MANQSLANLKLGLATLIGRPDQDPVREILLNCGIRTILERVNLELEELAEGTVSAVQGAANRAAEKAAADVLKKIGDILKEWDKAKQAVNAERWQAIHEVLYGSIAQELGLGAAIVKAVAEGEIRAWAGGFEADLQRTGGELAESTARALDELNKIAGDLKKKTLTDLGQILADSLKAPEILAPKNYAAQIKKALPPDLPLEVDKTIDSLLDGKPFTEEQGSKLAESLQKHAIKEATQYVKDQFGSQEVRAFELVETILTLPDRPDFKSPDGFNQIKAYAGVAQTALKLLGHSQAAQDVGRAVAIAQTGMQIYQAATVLMAASGWGVALGAVSLLGGMGSLSSVGSLGGGSDNTEVLKAIEALKGYLVKQFSALHERLDRIEENLQLIHQTLQEVKATVEELRWRLASLQEDTGNMQTQISLGTLALLEEIDEQKTIQWDAIFDAQLAISAREVVDFKAFFHSRVIDAFDGPRNLEAGFSIDPFEELGRLTRALSTQRRSDLPAFVHGDIADKGAAPIALLISAVNHYSAISLNAPKRAMSITRLAVNPVIALGAIERWLQVNRKEKHVPNLETEAKGLTNLSREHLRTMRKALDCVEGIAGMVRPPQVSLAAPPAKYAGPSSTVEVLIAHLDTHVEGFNKELNRVEWDAVRTYLLDMAGQLSTGGESQAHRNKWRSTPVSTATSIAFNIDTAQDQTFPEFKQLNLDHQHLVGQLPALLVRNLTASHVPAMEVMAVVVGSPLFETKTANQRGIMTPTYKLTCTLYGVPIGRLESKWSPQLYYTGLLAYGGSATNDYIWSRMGTPDFIQHPRRQLFWSWHQPGNSGADAKYPGEDIPNLTIWGVLRSRITAEYAKSEKWIRETKATSVPEAYALAEADTNEHVTAALLAHAVQPVRTAILNDYIQQHNSQADPTLAELRARLKELQNILVTIRASLLVGMPDAYLQLDPLHVLFDGHPTTLQLALPHAKLLDSGNWEWFTKIVEAECNRPSTTVPLVPNVKHSTSISESLPYIQAVKKAVYLLKRCIDKMTQVSPSTSVPVRVILASDALRHAEIAAGLLPGGKIQIPKSEPPKDGGKAEELKGDKDASKSSGGTGDENGGGGDEGGNGGKPAPSQERPPRHRSREPGRSAKRSNGSSTNGSMKT